VIRSVGDPAALVKSVRQAVLEVDPNQPVANVQTLKEIVTKSLFQRRFILALIGGFAGAALLLAAIGLYGVMAYAVSQRTREIGVRMALGARQRDVIALVLGQGIRIVLIGLGLGLAGAFGLARLLQGLLFQVKPTDPITFAIVPLVLLATALAACWLPAHRAAKVDPMEALRHE
jgi:putative ABC transport system permease protein